MAITRLDPPIPVRLVMCGISARWAGEAMAHAWIDYGVEHDLKWLCVCHNNEWFIASNEFVRAYDNLSFSREAGDAPKV